MPWVKINIIDGLEIIRGFNGPGIDPEETKKRVAVELAKTSEWKAAEKIKVQVNDQVRNLLKSRSQLSTQLKMSGLRQTKHAIARNSVLCEKHKAVNVEIDKYKQQINAALAKVSDKAGQLFDTCSVSLQGGGYREVDQPTWDKLHAEFGGLKPRQMLKADGSVIDDLRKLIYIHKIDGRWVDGRITKLGETVPPNGKPVNQLTDDDRREIMDQGKRDMIKEMEPSQRAKMLQGELDAAALQAAQLVTAYELQSRDAPREDARAWLTAEEKRIKEIFDAT